MKPEKPWWVKQRRFVIPSCLKERIQALPDEGQIPYCFIVSKVVIETKKHPAHYASISSKYFKDGIDTDYKQFVNQLVDWQIIDVNDSYLNGAGGGFSKSYRLHPEALKTPMVRVNFKKKQAQPSKDKSELTDEVAQFVYDNLKQLAVSEQLAPQENVIDEVDAEAWAEDVFFGKLNVHYSGKVKRLFHTVVQMSKVARKNLVLKADPSAPLFEYDVKSCTPVTLLGITDDPDEKTKLKTLLDSDIYGTIASDRNVSKDRDAIKEDFMLFLNGGVKNYFHKYFHTHLPKLTANIMGNQKRMTKGETVAWWGMRVESKIMCDLVPRQLMQSKLPSTSSPSSPLTCGGNPERPFYVPMHDGWLGIERDEQLIAAIVTDEFFKRLGYRITISKTALGSGEKKILTVGPQSPTSSDASKIELLKQVRKTFRAPSKEQVKKTARRVFKTNQFGETVLDKKALDDLRAQGYRWKMAQELDAQIKKSSQ